MIVRREHLKPRPFGPWRTEVLLVAAGVVIAALLVAFGYSWRIG